MPLFLYIGKHFLECGIKLTVLWIHSLGFASDFCIFTNLMLSYKNKNKHKGRLNDYRNYNNYNI